MLFSLMLNLCPVELSAKYEQGLEVGLVRNSKCLEGGVFEE